MDVRNAYFVEIQNVGNGGKMITLENWGVVRLNPFNPKKRYLNGDVYNHPSKRHPDGKRITTSQIMEYVGDNTFKTKLGPVYCLGKIDPVYDKMYPNALNQLIESFERKEIE